MQMIERIQSYQIPTNSYNAAIRYLRDQGVEDPSECRARIEELTGAGESVEDKKAPYVYLYVVQETIRKHNQGQATDKREIFNLAISRTNELVARDPWIVTDYPSTYQKAKGVIDGKPRKKKGAKKELAKKVYSENKDKGLTRKEFIQLLMDKVDMTPGSASTYYNNLKNGTL